MNQSQREAVLDFLLLAMFADGSVKLTEDERLYQLMNELGWESDRDPDEYAQLATSRVRGAIESASATDKFLGDLALRLGDAETRKTALELFAKLMQADDALAGAEFELQSKAKAVFGV